MIHSSLDHQKQLSSQRSQALGRADEYVCAHGIDTTHHILSPELKPLALNSES